MQHHHIRYKDNLAFFGLHIPERGMRMAASRSTLLARNVRTLRTQTPGSLLETNTVSSPITEFSHLDILDTEPLWVMSSPFDGHLRV
jgi:hypothetical protein